MQIAVRPSDDGSRFRLTGGAGGVAFDANHETETDRTLKLGIFGGTFNPIHLGHLLIAQDACEAFGLSRLLFIPSATPPHKAAPDLADARHRLAMVKLAVRDNPRFACSGMEIERGGVSYTIQTVRTLLQDHPKAKLYLLIGSDSLREFHQWKESRQLTRLCRIIAVHRPGENRFDFNRARLPGFRPFTLRGHPFDVASSDIRERLRSGKSVRYLVPEAVAKYIAKHRLYAAKPGKIPSARKETIHPSDR
jgi:nicotinate-nucleotide adenylyltransferase